MPSAGRLVEISLSPDGSNPGGTNGNPQSVQVPEGELLYVEEAFYILTSESLSGYSGGFTVKTSIGVNKELPDDSLADAGGATRLFDSDDANFTSTVRDGSKGQIVSIIAREGEVTDIGGYLYGGERVVVTDRFDDQSSNAELTLVLLGRRIL